MATESQSLLTAEQYGLLPDNGRPTELVRGKIVEMNVPYSRHGQVCAATVEILRTFAKQHDLGHVLSNDSGVITERNPDSVRGADVSFYSYNRVPRGRLPRGYLAVPPEIVIEVRSEFDRWSKLMAKAAEYLEAGVGVVCILDPDEESAHVVRSDRPPLKLGADEELTLPEMHESFRVHVGQFFE